MHDYKNYIQKFKVIGGGRYGIFQHWKTINEICRDIPMGNIGLGMACSCKMGCFEELLSPYWLQIVKISCKNMSIKERSEDIWCRCLESYKNNSISSVYRVPIEWEK